MAKAKSDFYYGSLYDKVVTAAVGLGNIAQDIDQLYESAVKHREIYHDPFRQLVALKIVQAFANDKLQRLQNPKIFLDTKRQYFVKVANLTIEDIVYPMLHINNKTADREQIDLRNELLADIGVTVAMFEYMCIYEGRINPENQELAEDDIYNSMYNLPSRHIESQEQWINLVKNQARTRERYTDLAKLISSADRRYKNKPKVSPP